MKFVVALMLVFSLYQENTPPTVKIIAPKADAVYQWNSSLRYSVQVSDKEDGDTKFEEIPSSAVLVEAHVADDTSHIGEYRAARTSLQAMMASNCMNCHTFESKLIGPSFADISKKKTDVNTLVLHVKQGSTGVWGNIVMPSHPELTQPEIQKMVQWILDYGKQTNVQYYTGTDGTIRIPRPEKVIPQTQLLLIASYVDKDNQKGEYVMSLKARD